MSQAWDENTLDVAFDALHEATGKRDIAEANRLAQLICRSARLHRLSLASFVSEAWGELEDAVCVGAAVAMFDTLTAHARQTDDLTLFGRLLANRYAEKALGVCSNGAALPATFVSALVDAARAATPQYRYAACLLLSNQERLFKLDLEPLGDFLFSCLADKPGNPRESSAKLAGWLIDEQIRRGRDRGGTWRAELTRRATGQDDPALVALLSYAKLAALDADSSAIAALLATRGSRLDTSLEGIERAFRVTKEAERDAFEVRLGPLLQPLRSAGSAKQKKVVAGLLSSFKPSESSGITPASAMQALVAEFLSAKPRQRHRLHLRLIDAVREDPSVANLLPLPWTMPEDAPRFDVSQLKLLALRELGDVKGLSAYLAAAPEPIYRRGAGYQFGNIGKKRERNLFATALSPLLNDEDAGVRHATLYFFIQFASREQGELAPWAYDLVRLTSDANKAPASKDFVASEARTALRFALKATKQRQAFVAAAQTWSLECDTQQRRLFNKAAQELLPELLGKK